jgi:hypothetical protein
MSTPDTALRVISVYTSFSCFTEIGYSSSSSKLLGLTCFGGGSTSSSNSEEVMDIFPDPKGSVDELPLVISSAAVPVPIGGLTLAASSESALAASS